MALIETNFIRPQEVYDRNTGESKVRYRSYDGNDRFIPVVEGENGVPKTLVEVTHAELKAMRDAGKLTPGALYRITDYNCTTTQENTQSAGHQFDIVLLALSENKLAEEGWAMMHDNIYDVTFGDGVTKKCYVYQTGEDEYNIVDTNTLLGYEASGEGSFDESGIFIAEFGSVELIIPDLPYNYFQNSNLSAWKVWYCLDNDKSRFAWADDSMKKEAIKALVGAFSDEEMTFYAAKYYTEQGMPESITIGEIIYYLWTTDDGAYIVATTSRIPKLNDDTYLLEDPTTVIKDGKVTAYQPENLVYKGRGVIYRLIDELNNDVGYDFKNIQFKRKITDGQYDANGTETWCYTLNVWYNDMCQDASIVGNTLQNDEGYVTGVYDNIFGYTTAYDLSIEGVNTFAFALGNNVVLSYEDDGYIGIYSNTIGNNFNSNTIGNDFNSNTIGNNFYSNTIGNDFNSNTIGNNFYSNMIGNNFYSNMIGNFFNGKTISNNTSSKNYGNNGVELATKS